MAGFRLYIDNSALNRPFDDQTQPRIWLEALAIGLIFTLVEAGEAEMIVSSVQLFENRRSSEAMRRIWVDAWLKRSSIRIRLSDQAQSRARHLQSQGFKTVDALHLGVAESAHATHFITCDDRVIQRYVGQLAVMTPPSFVTALGASNEN